jgi:hypothetical protein
VQDILARLAFPTALVALGLAIWELRPVRPRPSPQPLAGIDVSCSGGDTFTLSTGTKGGDCRTSQDAGGKVVGGICSDSEGNSATALCGTNEGKGACESTSGAGTCKKK